MLLTITWDPSPYLFPFALPLIGRPLLWYGFLFALGFFCAYRTLLYLLRSSPGEGPINAHPIFKGNRALFAEKVSFYVIIGGLLGARLGDLLFYQDLKALLDHPLSLISIWEGGLSSHGGAIGILIALFIFSKRYAFGFWRLLDRIVIPVVLAAIFIRTGNFINQEILGTPTQLPWGVLFLHPADGSSIVPRHPAQLYEALAYLFIFLILIWHQRKGTIWHFEGKLTGLFLLLVFGARFLVEYVKVEQSVHLHVSSLFTMGQYLSLPLLILGLYLYKRIPSNKKNEDPL